MMALAGSTRLLKALGDETRLRILHLLSLEELACSDLMEVLNMGQSRVSTHLNLLKEAGLVSDRRAGRRNLYSRLDGPQSELLQRVLEEAADAPEFAADAAGVESLRLRRTDESRAYFDRVAASFGEQILPGRTWEGLARAVLRLAPPMRCIDVGVGDGLLTLMLAEVAQSVTAVDISTEMLDQLEKRARAKGIHNLTTVEGALEDLPLPDDSFDVAILSQALHHAERPELALVEAGRVVAPGGRVLVIELLAHTENWVREKLQHRHLGFTEQDLERLLVESGLTNVTVQRAARDPQPPHFMTLVATGTRP